VTAVARKCPRCADDHSEARHWEGYLMIGADNASAVATLAERVRRLNPGSATARRL